MTLSEKITYAPGAEGCVADIHSSVVATHFEVAFRANNCRLEIGAACRFSSLKLYFLSDDTTIRIGRGTKVNSGLWANISGPGSTIEIGENCLFANVKLRTSDSHGIFDIETGELLNPPGDIKIGPKVWIAEDVLVLKGSEIGTGSVIGARSLVTSVIPPNCLAVGTPAKPIKWGIRWR